MAPVVVAPKDPGWTGRLDVGSEQLMAALHGWSPPGFRYGPFPAPVPPIAACGQLVIQRGCDEPGRQRLLSTRDAPDPFSGQPTMSGVAVEVIAGWSTPAASTCGHPAQHAS
jgi:hypothetical protein